MAVVTVISSDIPGEVEGWADAWMYLDSEGKDPIITCKANLSLVLSFIHYFTFVS